MQASPFIVSTLAINLIVEISALLERYAIALENEDGLRLRKANRIKTIHSSLAIEGNTLSEDEVADIVNGKNVVAPIRQIHEVRNAIKAYELYGSLNPFKEADLKRAHAVMMEALTDDAGRYRNGRLWQSLILGRLNPVFEHLPVENMVFSNQQRYYDAIAASTAAGQSGPFIDFMLTEIRDTLEKHKATEKVPNKVPDKVPNKSESRVLDLLLESPGITASAIAAKIGITDRAVRKIISSLKEQGLVERVGSNKSGYWKVNRK